MMLQVNCRGYATAQFMQPEPAKYAHAPNLEQKTFMHPEQPYYAHHPGRFFYVKDLNSGALFSSPYEPVRATTDVFEFHAEQDCIKWRVVQHGIEVVTRVSLSVERPLELWETTITNTSTQARELSLTPYFPVGYMSWMNQSAGYDDAFMAIVCRSITPYQKIPDYFKNKDFKDLTFLMAERPPASYETRQDAFEGTGGLHSPSALETHGLSNSEATYEMPTAAMQYDVNLSSNQSETFRFAFGPASNDQEIKAIRAELFGFANIKNGDSNCQPDKRTNHSSDTSAHCGCETANSNPHSAPEIGFEETLEQYQTYVKRSATKLQVATPDKEFDHFVNHWLARQVFYHGDVNRLTTDPQTRNYLQDSMGMVYLKPSTARTAFLTALAQQHVDGAMPDGVLLSAEAELKYINQVPHMDHCVWLPVCISAYLDETNDFDLLDQEVGFSDDDSTATVFEHISRAMHWLYSKRDQRGLSYIEQGDWCDPMNMVGYKGKGVSGWLTLATAYACKLWSKTCQTVNKPQEQAQFASMSEDCNDAVNTHMWQGDWYARGITDDGNLFGTDDDQEGKIFLNPQSWAMLSGAASDQQQASMVKAVDTHLTSPYGVEMLAPSFTKMREDIGRVTQKHPGSAENGSIYNHAAAFYVYALYQSQQRSEHADIAYQVMRKMIPSDDPQDLLQRGQLPVFIPNYYRGAYRQFERTAGRSSQLFNTGTVHWFYRCLIDGLFGLQGTPEGLRVAPQLPSDWPSANVKRQFRGAEFAVSFTRSKQTLTPIISVDGAVIDGNVIKDIDAGALYNVDVSLPESNDHH